MMRVPTPKTIVLDGEILNFGWQRLEESPESPGGDGFHFRDGHSRRRPFDDSLSASSKRKSSLPAEESASRCSSHRLCSRARNHWTIRRYSSEGNPSIAASISSTRLMLGVYHLPALSFILCLEPATPTARNTAAQSAPAFQPWPQSSSPRSAAGKHRLRCPPPAVRSPAFLRSAEPLSLLDGSRSH